LLWKSEVFLPDTAGRKSSEGEDIGGGEEV